MSQVSGYQLYILTTSNNVSFPRSDACFTFPSYFLQSTRFFRIGIHFSDYPVAVLLLILTMMQKLHFTTHFFRKKIKKNALTKVK